MSTVYGTTAWQELRERAHLRDADCVLGRLLGGGCWGALHTHHIEPVSDGGPELPDIEGVATLCARHHRVLHGLRSKQAGWKTCPHKPGTHRYAHAKRLCEDRLNGFV